MRKDAPFSARKRGYGRGLVTCSIRSDGIVIGAMVLFLGAGVLASVVGGVVVVDSDSNAFVLVVVAGDCSTSRITAWSSLPSVSRSDVDL